jgi:hypothetical protein
MGAKPKEINWHGVAKKRESLKAAHTPSEYNDIRRKVKQRKDRLALIKELSEIKSDPLL